MKRKLTISVVILTNDRPKLLEKALLSIEKQRVQPLEVVVVDDSSTLHTETVKVVMEHTKALPIVKRNTQHSISFGRTIGMKAAHGDIIVYLDDDCSADASYLKKFLAHFSQDPSLAAVVGRIKNARADNVFASTQYAYYDRGLKRYFPDLTKPSPLTWGRILDCEVMGIRKTVLKKVGFTERHRRYRNDDVDLGLRLLQKHYAILFDPTIVAWSSPRVALKPLWVAAFWNGYSDASTINEYHVDLRAAPYPTSFLTWFPQELKASPFTGARKVSYALLLLSFPIVSRLGMLWYRIKRI